MVIILGSDLESTATSDLRIGACEEDEKVNSPERRKPKKPKQQAAHNMTLLNVMGGRDQTLCSCLRIGIVMGKRLRWLGEELL